MNSPLDQSTAQATPQDAELITETSLQSFAQDIIEASKSTPVLVQFWAPWNDACQHLSKSLEQAVLAAKGGMRLVKANIEETQPIAQQLGVQSLPAVFLFKDGRPVDGFMGLMPPEQLAEFVNKHAELPEAAQLEELLESGIEMFEDENYEDAAQMFGAVLHEAPAHIQALAWLAKCAIKTDDLEQARETLAQVPDGKRNDPDITSAQAMLDLADKQADSGDLGALKQAVEQNPGDHQARFDLALAYDAASEKEAALEELFTIYKKDKGWNEEAARKQLLQFFDVWGPQDPHTLSGRRQLSSLLFS